MCVYLLVVLCVLFSPAAASLVPTEQLVLTTFRQEASELQDPCQGAGADMRARLTDRLDKSEFARIRLDDAQFESQGACGHAVHSSSEQLSPDPRPSRATLSSH